MKKKSVCILFVAVLCAAILGTGIAFAEDMEIAIRIAPNTLNLDNVVDKCVTVHADIAYITVDDDDANPLKLWSTDPDDDPVVAYDSFADDRGNLVAKFYREEVAEIVAAGKEVTLTLTGKTTGGDTFTGSDTIRVIDRGGK